MEGLLANDDAESTSNLRRKKPMAGESTSNLRRKKPRAGESTSNLRRIYVESTSNLRRIYVESTSNLRRNIVFGYGKSLGRVFGGAEKAPAGMGARTP